MSTKYPVVFDGHELTKFFSVRWGLERPLPEWTPNLVTVPGRAGAILAGTHAEPTNVSMELVYIDTDRAKRQEAARTLASWLAVDEARPLILGDEGGLYRMAIPSGAASVTEYLNAESINITFTCPDPIMWGGEHQVVVPSDGEVTFKVGGTAPTRPLVVASQAQAKAAVGWWRLTLDGLHQFDVAVSTSSTQQLSADCENRVLLVSGSPKVLRPTCSWIELEPGEHTLAMDGYGAATVTWRDRWW